MDLYQLFNEFNSKKVLIVGDSMIDAYMWGDVNRLSPEAPVPIVEVKKHENRLGGAANVALNLKSLGSNPILCSVVGKDNKGFLFKSLMENEQLSTNGLMMVEKRKTTIKTRIIAKEKHQLRIDEEESSPIIQEEKFLKLVKSFMDNIDVIILQDYNKGVLTTDIIKNVILIANRKGIPTIVDPKIDNFFSYKNCTMFKPNLEEIKRGMNINFQEDNIIEIKQVTSNLRKMINAKSILLTLSERGICINTEKLFSHTPAFDRDMIDVSGAGDTVISVAALCLACNIEYNLISTMSNLAGGIVCEEVGVVPINKKKFLHEAKKILFNEKSNTI